MDEIKRPLCLRPRTSETRGEHRFQIRHAVKMP